LCVERKVAMRVMEGVFGCQTAAIEVIKRKMI
jgi:hypothetical protein